MNKLNGKIIALVGPSGAGKSTLINKAGLDSAKLITHTTRKIRPGESIGFSYYFEKEYDEEPSNMLVDNYAGNWYWTKKQDIINKLNKDHLAVMIITLKGYLELIGDPDLAPLVYGIYFDIDDQTLIKHLNERSDSSEARQVRIKNLDAEKLTSAQIHAFKNRPQNYILDCKHTDAEFIRILQSIIFN